MIPGTFFALETGDYFVRFFFCSGWLVAMFAGKGSRIGLCRDRMVDVLAVVRDGAHARFQILLTQAQARGRPPELAERHANINLTTFARSILRHNYFGVI